MHNTGPFRFDRTRLDIPHTGPRKNVGPSMLRILFTYGRKNMRDLPVPSVAS